MVKYFITGGCGFFGRHMVRCLLRHAPEVTEIVAYDVTVIPAMEFWSPRLKLVRGSVNDAAAVTKAMMGADVVIHAASIVDVWYRVPDEEIYRVNVNGTSTVLSCCVPCGVKVFVNTSSMEVVGPNNRGGPFIRGNEKTPYQIVHEHIYPLSKAKAEQLVSHYTGVSVKGGKTLRTCSLRPTGIYGEECDLLAKFYSDSVAAGNVSYGGSPDGSEHGRVYAGNVAWMHLQASRALMGPKWEQVNGQAFFCYDDSPYLSYDDFNAQLFEDCDFTRVKVPYAVMKPIAVMNDIKRKVAAAFGKTWAPILNSYTLSVARTSFTVKTNKAYKAFAYAPLYTWSQSKANTKLWIKSLRKN
ncbi:putative 3-beta-hydroxy-delta-5-C27 steroid oxidoreductase-like protein [Largemouth bass virus]|uniref:3-beta-hydroxy-delta-5-C27 steroid oxidoreductase-like protein n=1 Tax=Largemouth bass virus TaxID=176656 RepID=A0A9E7PPB6_9VIRU|nr:putative 3-beta-hydroxy-delta-5-C27 steroid oxidoreductase-like protein [Mandarin fish ranavirus]UUY86203.1 putative 3-beta-hydroxy-delta-5-C27 steroid oxidoreductase-like protein [Largemouth bass virus]WEI29039.1 putative 3-beta-hydroxy-delta-5-C27 steroid oxidoreductase-like protein [Largemouth bass virus]WHA35502.1 putative 3-beta-hydroxy-delta-5-C27-steroid oxidoreductase [Micropterus salmoides ranavirus]WHA35607.1 putative 3-beta-hydroxy-delta-5-C27-steroid oxidoreductase [Siniperca chu